MGNLKFDIEPPPAMLELGKRLRGQFGANRNIFLAASTREGEEALLLDAIAQAGIPELLTVIVMNDENQSFLDAIFPPISNSCHLLSDDADLI